MTKTALITGASSGIGYELADIMAQDGYDLVIVARSTDKLTQIAQSFNDKYGVKVHAIAKDLSDPTAPDTLFAETEAQGLQIDVLINNAGFATYGTFNENDLNRELQMIQLNMTTLTHLTHLYLQGMIARGNGKIMNVASTAAFQPGPLMAVYYATKSYVLYFSEAIANELKDTGVTVTALCPGPTESGFQARAQMEESKLVQNSLMNGRIVAQQGYEAMLAGKTIVVPGFSNKVTSLVPRIIPRNLATQIVRNVQERSH